MAGLAALLVAALAFVGAGPPAQARGTRLAIPAQELGSTPALLVSHVDSEGISATSIVLLGIPEPTNTPPARIVFYVPKGYEIRLGAVPAGSTVGFAIVLEADQASLLDGSTSTLQDAFLFGSVVTADPSALATDAAAQACAPGSHLGAWLVQLVRKSGEKVQVAMLIDAAAAGDPGNAAYKIQMCPPSTGGKGFLITGLGLTGSTIVEPAAPGAYLWRAYVTPAAAGSSEADPAHTYEVRAASPLPQRLTLRGIFDPGTKMAVLRGEATELGRPKAGLNLTIRARSRHATSELPVTTDASGRYSLSWPVREDTSFTASAELPDFVPCGTGSTAPAGCLSQSTSLQEDQRVTVKVPVTTDAKRALRAADRASAARVNLKLTDFPAGWSSRAASQDDFPVCSAFHPNESRLTLTGISYSPLFLTGNEFVPSSLQAAEAIVKVWQTPAQARAAFNREASIAQVQCVIDDADDDEYIVLGSGPIPLGKLARVARGFRVITRDLDDGTIYYLDVIEILGKRSVATLTLSSGATQPPLEQALVARLAARIARV